ncbi:MAG: iron ABC transporter permease, partial [Desulfovibrio sp.]|uniref:iron chelate uptake ABC transporter family permease subunit n=1 Tax=Desulfovibrio sp. TaxID=885 RepID=UPI002587F7DB
ICFTGVIGFIGLVAPHVARFCLGGDNRLLLPGAAFFGAGLVTLADAVARTLLGPQVIPVGIVTAFLGVPFFFWLLLRRGQHRAGGL